MKTGSSIIRLLTRGPSKSPYLPGCPGSKADDCLVIECSRCNGPQDLGQIQCLRGCLRTLSKIGEVDRIGLSKDIVIEYRGRSVATLLKLSAPLASCRPAAVASSRKCLRCPIEPSRLLGQLLANWPPMPPPNSFRVPLRQGGGAQCLACRNRTLGSMETAREDFSALTQQMNQISVKVLGGRR